MSNRITKLLLVLLASIALVFFFYQKNYNQPVSYLSGDEPHYIMMTDSLAEDGDFNLRNDYELQRSLDYYPVPDLFPHVSSAIDIESQEWYSVHTVGLPLIMYAPYEAFGVTGARLMLMALQFSSVVLLYFILKRYVKSPKRVWLGTGLWLACPLFWQNLGSIYPDLLMVSIWGAVILLFGRQDIRSNILIMALILLGALSHSKGLVLIGPLVLLHVLWLIRQHSFKGWLKKYWLPTGLIAAGGLSYVYFLRQKYGVWTPAGLYGTSGQLFNSNPVYNVIAMLTDRSKGFLVHFPLLLVVLPYVFMALADLVKLAKKAVSKRLKFTENHYLVTGVVLGLLILLVTLVGFIDWSGSTAPNGRSMLPVIIAVIFVVAKYINLRNWVELVVVGAAALLSAWLSWLSITDFIYYMSSGVNSFWVDRFPPLERLPLFGLFSTEFGKGPAIRGAKILLLLLAFNVTLAVLYKYRVTFKRWKS